MELLELGKVHKEYIGMPEGISSTLTESGVQVLITFDKPIQEEITQIRSGQAQFKLLLKNDIPFMLSKFGKLDWMESPIRVDDEQLQGINNMNDVALGYGMYVILTDVSTGIIHALRAIGLGNGFSKELNKMLLRAPILSKEEYIKKVFAVQRAYTTKELVKMTNISYNAGTTGV